MARKKIVARLIRLPADKGYLGASNMLATLQRGAIPYIYHKRSNIETTFRMIKSKFGQRLRSKTLIDGMITFACIDPRFKTMLARP